MTIPGADPAKFVELAEASSGQQLHPEKAKLAEWTRDGLVPPRIASRR